MKNGGRILWSVTAICETIQDLLSDGKTPYERWFGMPFNGPVTAFGAMVEYHPISAKDISRVHQFGPKVLPRIFLSYVLYAGRISRHCISCLSCAPWQSGDDIHDFCCCHLWCWWTLFSEYCIRPWIVFHNITSEYISTFCIFGALSPSRHFFKWQMSISEAKWTFAPFVLASSITSDLLLTFVRSHAGIFSSFSHYLSTAAFAAGIFMAWGIGINLCTKLWCCSELSPFRAIWSSW